MESGCSLEPAGTGSGTVPLGGMDPAQLDEDPALALTVGVRAGDLKAYFGVAQSLGEVTGDAVQSSQLQMAIGEWASATDLMEDIKGCRERLSS